MSPRRPHSSAGSTPLRLRPARARPQALSWRSRMLWMGGFAAAVVALVWILRPVLAILAASAGIAYVLDPIADWLERRGLSRDTAIGVIYVGFILIVALTGLLLVPGFVRQGAEFKAQVVPFVQNFDEVIAPALRWISEKTGQTITLDLQDPKNDLSAWLEEHAPRLQEKATSLASGLLTQGLGFVSAILNLTLLPIFVYYLLRDWDRIVAGVAELIPPRHRPRVGRVATEVDRRLSAFVRGQIMVCLALAGMYSAGLLLVGIDLAIPVGVLSGLLFIVPYLGTAVGIVLGTLLALMKFGVGWEVLGVLVVFTVSQLIEGYVLTPKIVGDQVGLPAVVVMIALIVGGSLMGVWGMAIAIPVTAVLSVLGAEWLASYRQSRIYGD